MKKYFTFLITSLILAGCSFSGDNPLVPDDARVPNSPSPANNSVDQALAVTLKWNSDQTNLYDVYLDTKNPPTVLKSSNIGTSKSAVATGLKYNTTYYWKVVAKLSDGSKIEGPVWKFSTKSSSSSSSGYVLINHDTYTELPSLINILFQVVDFDGRGIETLSETDFELFEDGEKISQAESNLEIFKKNSTPYELRTVLMLDNSTSIAPHLSELINSANDFVTNLVPGQKVAIYKFSENPELLIDFTDNVSQLTAAVNSINVGFATTNLYGAVVEGASKLTEVFDIDNIIQSGLIIFTDGQDTQGSHLLSEALDAVNGEKVYTVGFGDDIDPEVLGAIGTSGFYSINEITQLSSVFAEIENSLSVWSNSFYWLRYQSPKRGAFDHTLLLQIVNNPNTGAGSTISDNFSSASFFSVNPGMYFNASASSPTGTDTMYLFLGSGSKNVNAYSFLAPNPPSYSWSSPDTNIAKVTPFSSDNSRATLTPGTQKGVTSTLVTDVNNTGVSKRLYIKVD